MPEMGTPGLLMSEGGQWDIGTVQWSEGTWNNAVEKVVGIVVAMSRRLRSGSLRKFQFRKRQFRLIPSYLRAGPLTGMTGTRRMMLLEMLFVIPSRC